MLVLAYFAEPRLVGIYGLAVVCLLFVQSAGDSAVRQIAVLAIKSREGRQFLRRYRVIAGSIGCLFILVVSFVIVLVYRGEVPDQSLYALFFLSVIPVFQASRVFGLAELQLAGQWRRLASFQLLASIVSFVFGFVILLLTRSLIAPCIQMVLAEGLFACACIFRRPAKYLGDSADEHSFSVGGGKYAKQEHFARSEFWSMSTYSILGWGQIQSDRLLMGFSAGPAVLGSYSVASAISRSGGDAAAMSSANILRSSMANSNGYEARAIEKLLLRGLLVVLVAVILSVALSELFVRRLLSAEWSASVDIVPLLALGSIPAYLAWNTTVVLVVSGRANRALPAKLLGVFLSVGVAFAAAHSLTLAAVLAVSRDVVVCLLTLTPARKLIPKRVLCSCLLAFSVGAVASVCLLLAGGGDWSL